MSTFLIISPNGYGNVGDDICAYSGEYLAKSINPRNKTIVTSPPFKEELAAQADVIVLSGGGVLYDRSEENVDNYLQYLEYAQKNGKNSAVVGVGVQGIVTDRGKSRYKEVLNKTDLVTVRSQDDKDQLDEIGVKNVIATQDLGFLSDEWVKKPFFKKSLKNVGKPKLGLILMDVRFLQAYKKGNQNLRDYIEIVENNLPQLAQNFDVYLFTHSRDDEDWRNQMAAKYDMKIVPYKKIKDFSNFFSMYQQMDFVVGLRFHSVILGLLAGKPVVGVGSSGAKLFKLAKSLPTLQKQCYALGDTEKVKYLFENLKDLYERGEFVAIPPQELQAIKALALKNKDLLEKALS